MVACAYCGVEAKPTAEHIWPKNIIAKCESMLTYNPKKHQFHGGELTIKDVCHICNSGTLSQLDNYAAAEFDKHFARILNAGESPTFTYDYEKLLRFLLKVSYNSSRTTRNDKSTALHKRYIKFILNGGYNPGAVLRLLIVTSAHEVNLETMERTDNSLRPVVLRCASTQYTGPLSNRFVIRLLAINSFWFYLYIPIKPEPAHKWKQLFEGLTQNKNNIGVVLSSNASSVHIPKTQTTYFHPGLIHSMHGASKSKS